MFAGAVLWLAAAMLRTDLLRVREAGLASLMVYLHRRGLMYESPKATTDAFDAQSRFKSWLHDGIWRGAFVLALMLVLRRVMG
jgi:hypothetical protein